LQAVLSTTSVRANRRKLDTICKNLRCRTVELQHKFSDQTLKTLAESKVHAEIQLIYYIFELRISHLSPVEAPRRLPPRVISSSKDACWLCHEFILMHGKLHVPGGHGRLYPGWRLPNLRSFPDGSAGTDDPADRFRVHLQAQMAAILDKIFDGQNTRTLNYPLESQISLLPWSASTISSSPENKTASTLSIANQMEVSGPGLEQGTDQSDSGGKSKTIETSDMDRTQRLSRSSSSAPLTPSTPMEIIDDLNSVDSDRHELSCTPNNVLVEESELEVGEKSLLYGTDELNVQIEYGASNSDRSQNGSDRKTLHFSIEQLNAVEAASLRENPTVKIFDAENLSDEVSCEPDGKGYIYIAAHRTVLRIYGLQKNRVGNVDDEE
ncbi:hypothetical protein F5Y15DRAFT_421944, partial [Xylariaceae sp. FL0016]